jgi:formylglycine-generating enzyme required for sulfatase activity
MITERRTMSRDRRRAENGSRSLTSRYDGDNDELPRHYAWYNKNSGDLLQRAGTKKPNDLGLFDAQGNCFTWRMETLANYPATVVSQAVEGKENDLVVNSTLSRVPRGGGFHSQASNVRSSYRLIVVPTTRFHNFGFRPSRTLVPKRVRKK